MILLADGWDFLATNWLMITGSIATACIAVGTAFGASVRAIYVWCIIPTTSYLTSKVDTVEKSHTSLIEQLKKTNQINSDSLTQQTELMTKIASNSDKHDKRLDNIEAKLSVAKCSYPAGGS